MSVAVHNAGPGPLVGRQRELRALVGAIERAAAGRTQVVAICGEAGIGKTRLAREALRAARDRGFRTLESAAGRLHRDLSYAPVVEALRPLVADPVLVDGLSDLARLFDGLRLPPLVALGDPGLERTRMFEAVRALLERASGRAPLAMLIDDLHWADRGTLALLHYVARSLPDRRCLVLTTYRADEASADLNEVLAALQRAETLMQIRLTGLKVAAVGDLAAALLGGPVPAALTDMLVRRSSGVPLFVRAIVLRLVETGALTRSAGQWVLSAGASAEVPALVSTLIRGRIEALPAAARRVLDVLAVCGGAAEHVIVQDVAADDLVEGIDGLRTSELVVEETRAGALWYRVVHPVLAEAAYDVVPLMVRRRWHARLAAAVGRHRPQDVRLLAAHVRGAGDEVEPARALDVLAAATRADLARRAGEEARASARAGLDLARRLGRDQLVEELSGAYAEACELAGGVEEALNAWVDAAECAEPRTRARRLTRAAILAWELGRFADAYPLVDAADRALAPVGPCLEQVDVEGARVRLAGRAGDLVALDETTKRLAVLQRTSTSSHPRAVALLARIGLAIQTGRYADAMRLADDVLTLVRGEELTLDVEALLRPATLAHVCWGDLPGARASALEGIRVAGQIGVPALGILHGTMLAFVDLLAGEWQAAKQRMVDDLDLAHRAGTARGSAFALTIQGLLLVRRGDLDEAADRIRGAHRLFGGWSAADRHVFAIVDLVDGLLASARHEVDRALAAAGAANQFPTIPPLALALLGEAQAAAGDNAGALRTASTLAALGPAAPYPAALSAWISGLAAGARRDPPAAVDALDRLDAAVAGFSGLGMPYEAAVARLDRAPVRIAAGADRDDVAEDVAEALRVLHGLGAKPQADRARALLRDLGRRPGRGARGHGAHRLSDREEEVARLVAQGLTNAEVAERLFISPRTVTTHLQNIYRRLELPSRKALISYVHAGSAGRQDTSGFAADT
ncbi:MAG TPA: AAA family ATPase [Pseudonocardiaceae bacterium]